MKITRRQFVQAMAIAGASALLTACGGSSGSTAGSGAAAATGGSFNLKLGHNLAEDHAVHIQLTSFAEQVKEKTGGSVNIQIIPNGTLGSEADMISQVQAGALDMAKVSGFHAGQLQREATTPSPCLMCSTIRHTTTATWTATLQRQSLSPPTIRASAV